jgi:hypothetical protein
VTRNGGFDAAVPTNSPEKAASLARKRVSRAGSATPKTRPRSTADTVRQTRQDKTRQDKTRQDKTRHI